MKIVSLLPRAVEEGKKSNNAEVLRMGFCLRLLVISVCFDFRQSLV